MAAVSPRAAEPLKNSTVANEKKQREREREREIRNIVLVVVPRGRRFRFDTRHCNAKTGRGVEEEVTEEEGETSREEDDGELRGKTYARCSSRGINNRARARNAWNRARTSRAAVFPHALFTIGMSDARSPGESRDRSPAGPLFPTTLPPTHRSSAPFHRKPLSDLYARWTRTRYSFIFLLPPFHFLSTSRDTRDSREDR